MRQRTVVDNDLMIAQIMESADGKGPLLWSYQTLREQRDGILGIVSELVVKAYCQSQHEV